jgi:hypothetical protein
LTRCRQHSLLTRKLSQGYNPQIPLTILDVLIPSRDVEKLCGLTSTLAKVFKMY